MYIISITIPATISIIQGTHGLSVQRAKSSRPDSKEDFKLKILKTSMKSPVGKIVDHKDWQRLKKVEVHLDWGTFSLLAKHLTFTDRKNKVDWKHNILSELVSGVHTSLHLKDLKGNVFIRHISICLCLYHFLCQGKDIVSSSLGWLKFSNWMM